VIINKNILCGNYDDFLEYYKNICPKDKDSHCERCNSTRFISIKDQLDYIVQSHKNPNIISYIKCTMIEDKDGKEEQLFDVVNDFVFITTDYITHKIKKHIETYNTIPTLPQVLQVKIDN